MIAIWFCICMALVSAYNFMSRVEKNKNLALKYRFKLFALRDKLRMCVIDEKIVQENWVVNYLDKSLSVCVNQMQILTIYQVFYLNALHRNDEKLVSFSKKIEKEFNKNPALKEIYEDYGVLLMQFFNEKHKDFIVVFGTFFKLFSFYSKCYFNLKTKILAIRLTPEMSAMQFAVK